MRRAVKELCDLAIAGLPRKPREPIAVSAEPLDIGLIARRAGDVPSFVLEARGKRSRRIAEAESCLLYTSDAADE